MTYRVQVAPAAARQLRKLDRSARRRLQAALELLVLVVAVGHPRDIYHRH